MRSGFYTQKLSKYITELQNKTVGLKNDTTKCMSTIKEFYDAFINTVQ